MLTARLMLPLALVAAGCQTSTRADAVAPVAVPQSTACSCPAPTDQTPPSVAATHSHRSVLPVCDADGELPLVAARRYLDESDAPKGLACAAQACALMPKDVLAHAERGNALLMLGRFDEAKQAFARALALDPDDLDALLGAAHLYAVSLPSSRDNDELGSLYAERGLNLAHQNHDADMVSAFGRLAAMALNDLGQSAEALERASLVLQKAPHDAEASFERAVALFELCRFADAKKAFTSLEGDGPEVAASHHYLGLLFEREGRTPQAEAQFALARQLNPDDFHQPVDVGPEAFAEAVRNAVAALPEDMRRDLKGVVIEGQEIPSTADLTGDEPPLSPTILGLFRGPPLGEPCEAGLKGPCRSVVLYRKNLARATHSKDAFLEQLEVTLIHEVGHLRGEDDGELAARGLE